ncbi:MAG: endolytic transglycosylase MltG [Anaeromyxobacter sp.]|nr:endolytic transglycosylase MltG [Anaeromyxobacter sp.]
MRVGAVLLLAALAAAAAFAWVAWRELEAFRTTPHGATEEVVVEIAPGSSPRAVVRALARAGVLADDELAWRYVRWVKKEPRPFKAGEYAFAGLLTPDQALERVYRGEIRLYRFTVPEGLRAEEIAEVVARSGLATAEDFLLLARDPAVARAAGVPFDSLEGYLFPDTYAFAKGVTARQIVDAMLRRFREAWTAAEAGRGPGVTLDEAQAVTLASIVEKETGQVAERPRIACVFHNRLARGMRLQTDPTVMYATFLRTGRWSKNISRADLLAAHPYNTYTTAGLPPGPIASPGAAALAAALAPATCADLFFVSRNDGTHVFCPDLACHEAAVRQWQVEFFRRKRP